jgi:hypothetical protein
VDVLRKIQHTPEYLNLEHKSALPSLSLGAHDLLAQNPESRLCLCNDNSSSKPSADPFIVDPSTSRHRAVEGASVIPKRTKSLASLTPRPSFRSLGRSFKKPSSATSNRLAPHGTAPRNLSDVSLASAAELVPVLRADNPSTASTSASASPSAFSDNVSNPPDGPASSLSSLVVAFTPPISKPLAFRDLLIKPIQRVCRYPLLLSQLRIPISIVAAEEIALKNLELAIDATKNVATGVDDAQKKRDAAFKSALILERLSPHLVCVSALGSCSTILRPCLLVCDKRFCGTSR